jgi:hypothetical protein
MIERIGKWKSSAVSREPGPDHSIASRLTEDGDYKKHRERRKQFKKLRKKKKRILDNCRGDVLQYVIHRSISNPK